MIHVIPDTRIVWIQTCRQTEPRRDTDRRCRDTIREPHPFACDAVQIWGLHPVTTTPHRVPSLLIGHKEKNIRSFHSYPLSIPASVKARESVS